MGKREISLSARVFFSQIIYYYYYFIFIIINIIIIFHELFTDSIVLMYWQDRLNRDLR